jgi:hypothetical protein
MSAEFQQGNDQFSARAKRLLDQSMADLDPSTAHRLQRARVTALDAKPTHRWWMIWTSGLAMAGVAALAVALWTKQPSHEHRPVPLFEDLDLVISAENVDLAEDLDFYHWLADADRTG